MVIWVVGPSGAGKSTLADALLNQWRRLDPATVLIDGDVLRAVFGSDTQAGDYTLPARRRNADRLAGLTAWLDSQGMNVVAAVMLLFDEVSDRNRAELSGYHEVAIETPFHQLRERDPKGLYAAAEAGQEQHVVGVDLPWTPTSRPDQRIPNDGPEPDWERVARDVLARAGVT